MIHRLLSLLLLLVASCAPMAAPALAATIPVTPATYLAALAAAQPGDVLAAAPGAYPAATVANRVFAPPVTLVAPVTAVFGTLALRAVDGFATLGGSFSGNALYGIVVDHSRNITIDRPLFADERTGLAVGYAVGLTVPGFECRGMAQDCIDLFASQHVKLLHGLCHGNVPRPGAHPDCVQMRSDAATPPLADIEVGWNEVTGDTQGFDLFGNKVAATGVNVHDNRGVISESNFVNLLGIGCTGCAVTDNIGIASRGAGHVVNVLPWTTGGGFTGTIRGNVVSARPAALPQ